MIMAKGRICPAVVRSEGDLLYSLMLDASESGARQTSCFTDCLIENAKNRVFPHIGV